MEEKFYAIIVAGGRGVRMGESVAKQFLNLGDKPVLAHTVERFLSLSFPVEIVLVLPAEYKEYWKNYYYESGLRYRHTLVSGGLTRFHSVKNALEHIKSEGLVAVHDGVRPFVSKEFIESLYDVAKRESAVVPVLPLADSLREVGEDGVFHAVERSNYLIVQTPQVFKSDILLDAYRQPYDRSFTDDASVIEAMGVKIHHMPGITTNIKLTNPQDMLLAEAILSVF